MSLIEDDDDDSVKECVLEAEKQGNVRSTTLKPISDEEGKIFENTVQELYRIIK